MKRAPRFRRLVTFALTTFLALSSAGAGLGQAESGNLFGTTRSDGGPLPGVTVELSGLGASLVQTSDGQGNFRFPGLAPGVYRLSASLDGFSPIVYESVTLAVGRNTALEVALLPEIEETITITAQSPILDERRISAGATVSKVELEKIPTARDPWVILQSVPGVLTSSVNVGGNKSGYQQGFTGTGSPSWDNTYAIDGVVITDAAAGNSSSTYYDFGSLEEIEVSTGGTEISKMSGGVTLNMVTKRGTNQWRGAARYIVADDGWQSRLAPNPRVLGEGQTQFTQGDRLTLLEEYGVEGGGPLIRDRFWGFGFYSKNGIDRLTIDDVRDFTELETYGLKLNFQVTEHNSGVAFLHDNRKRVDGRGASPSRTQPATQDQDGQNRIYKIENTQIVGSGLFLTGLVSYVHEPFSLLPKGGIDGPTAVLDQDYVWQNNYWWGTAHRQQRQATVEGGLFFSTGEIEHELRFGAGYRRASTRSASGWPGYQIRLDYYTALGYAYNIVEFDRDVAVAYSTDYSDLYAQDTLLAGKTTVNLGLRYDRQQGRLNSASVPGVPGMETLPDGSLLLPAVSFDGSRQKFSWDDIAPRLGLTRALGEKRETLIRASYSRFATQMDQWYQWLEWPISGSYAGFYYDDDNGDGRVSAGEVVGLEEGPLYTNGYDPRAERGRFDLDPSFHGAVNDEVILGIEHALMPELVVGLSATWRRQSQMEEYERLVEEDGVVRPHLRGDYELFHVDTVTLPDGSTRDVEVYGLRKGVADTGRTYVTNGDRRTEYRGLNLTLNKRLSNRWMLRGHFSWSDWIWRVPASEREEPNNRPYWSGGADDGGPVWSPPISPGWSYRLGGLVQIAPDRPWGFDLAANLWGRQGYAIAYIVAEKTRFADGLQSNFFVTRPLDEYRLPDVHLVDLRLDKSLKLGEVEATVGVECFNVFNRSTVLRRNSTLRQGRSDWVQEVVSPRIFRLNLRLAFH